MGVGVAVLAACALCLGPYTVSLGDTLSILASRFVAIPQTWSSMAQNVILEVRLPRILGALLVGASLAFGVQGAAFAGGLGAVACTVTIPKLLKRDSTVTLVLSGIIVGGFCGSILGLVKYLADPETQLPEIVYWQMGSLAKVDYGALASIAPVMVVSMTAVLVMRWRINVLSLGDHEAKALGVNLKVERGVVIFFATLLTASAVSLAGTIGWVGLVIPHLARFVVGPNASRSIPVACLMAAGFMLVVDTLARVSGIEIPLGILTGFIGTPFFIVLLARQRGLI